MAAVARWCFDVRPSASTSFTVTTRPAILWEPGHEPDPRHHPWQTEAVEGIGDGAGVEPRQAFGYRHELCLSRHAEEVYLAHGWVAPGGYRTRGSHRSGLARFAHPAPRSTGSLRYGRRYARRAE